MDLNFLNVFRRRKKLEEEGFYRKKSKLATTSFLNPGEVQWNSKPIKRFKTYNEILQENSLKRYKQFEYPSPKKRIQDLEPLNDNTPYNTILMNGTRPSSLQPKNNPNQFNAVYNPNRNKESKSTNNNKPLINPGLKKGLYKQEERINAQEVLKRNQLMLQQKKKQLEEQEAAFKKKMKEENERLEKMHAQKRKLEQEQNAQKTPGSGTVKKFLMAAGLMAVPAATAISSKELINKAYLQPAPSPDRYNFETNHVPINYTFQPEEVKNLYTFEE